MDQHHAHTFEDPLEYLKGHNSNDALMALDKRILDFIEDQFREYKSKKFSVLDLGCGPGGLTPRVAERLSEIDGALYSVLGIDQSESFIAYAEENNSGKAVSYVCSDFLAHEFHQKKFSIIFMVGVLHHAPKKVKNDWIRKLVGLLETDGILLIGDTYKDALHKQEEISIVEHSGMNLLDDELLEVHHEKPMRLLSFHRS